MNRAIGWEIRWQIIMRTVKRKVKEISLRSTADCFFLGVLLGAVFLFGTVLIMYYKQISEGYEDQDRFNILMKVGMTKKK